MEKKNFRSHLTSEVWVIHSVAKLTFPFCQRHDFLLIGVLFYQFAIPHLEHAIHILAHAQIVRDHDAGAVVLVDERREGLHHLEGALGVEAGGWFVREDQGGVVDQRAGDGDALLLSA